MRAGNPRATTRGWDFGFGIYGLWLQVKGLRFKDQGLGFRVEISM